MKKIFLLLACITSSIWPLESAISKPLSIECSVNEFSLVTLLLNKEKKCGQYFTGRDIREVVEVLDNYWDLNATNESRYGFLSVRYRDLLRKAQGITTAKDYKIPATEYERAWSGYKISSIKSFDEKRLQVTLKIQWFQEGYTGGNNIYF